MYKIYSIVYYIIVNIMLIFTTTMKLKTQALMQTQQI